MFPKFLNPIEVHSVHALGLGAIFALFFWPIGFLVYCLNVSLRFISQKLCDFYYPGRYFISDGEDSVFGVKLHGSSKSYIHGYKVIRGKPDLDVIRAKVEQVFTKTKGYEKLRYAMTPKFGYFCWDTQVPFDPMRNIRLLDDFDPEEIVDEARLMEICSKMVGTTCHSDMPQWEILMIPKYRMEDEEVTNPEETTHYALIIRLHHAYCDGISFVLLTNNFLADSPGELPIDPMKAFNNPVWIKAYIWANILIVGPLNFFKNLAIMMITPCNFRVDRYLSPKILARSSPVEMDTLRELRVASGTSVTAITLAAVFGAAYKTHLRLFPGRPVPKTMHLGSVGVMLPYSEGKRLSNQFTMWKYGGPLVVSDPRKRLTLAYEEVRKNASQPDPVFNFYMQRALGSLPKFLHEILFNLSGTPFMLSNVPGYKTPVRAFGGEIVDVAAWIPLVTTTGIGLSSQSYCGKMHFAAVSDPQLFPTANELKQFLEDIVNEIRVLAEAYGIYEGKPNNNILTMPPVGHIIPPSEGRAECLTSPQNNQHKKDVNDNENSPVLPTKRSSIISSSSESTLTSSPSNDGAGKEEEIRCRIRKDHNVKVISGTEPADTTHSTPLKVLEKVI